MSFLLLDSVDRIVVCSIVALSGTAQHVYSKVSYHSEVFGSNICLRYEVRPTIYLK